MVPIMPCSVSLPRLDGSVSSQRCSLLHTAVTSPLCSIDEPTERTDDRKPQRISGGGNKIRPVADRVFVERTVTLGFLRCPDLSPACPLRGGNPDDTN